MSKSPHKPCLTAALGLILSFMPLIFSLAAPQVADVTFTDVTDEAGLTDRANVEGAAWGDFDQDGDLDLFACHHITVPPAGDSVLYQNNGNGTFTELFRMGQLLGSAARRNNASGKNDDHSAVWGDYDNDGDLDLFISRGNSQADSLMRNEGQGVFIDVAEAAGVADPGGRGRTATWVDVDNDGHLDLFVANNHSPNRLFHNQGDGTFTDITARAGLQGTQSERKAAVWADYDRDGFMDLFTTESRDPRERESDPPVNRLYRNNGDLIFTEVTTAAGLSNEGLSEGATWGDFDNDGDPDLFVTMENGPNRLYQNSGDGTFTEIGAQAGVADQRSGRAAIWGDYDNDGDLDLFVIVATGPDQLYRNNDDGTFTNVAMPAGITAMGSTMQFGAAGGDFNNDGFLDLFLTDQLIALGRQSHLLYRNNGNQNHWLKIKLVGTVSNRDGVGTKITLTAGGGIQFREQNGGSHLLSQNSTIIHVGLDQRTTVDALTIEWPSGIRQQFTNVTVDQMLTVVEPSR